MRTLTAMLCTKETSAEANVTGGTVYCAVCKCMHQDVQREQEENSNVFNALYTCLFMALLVLA